MTRSKGMKESPLLLFLCQRLWDQLFEKNLLMFIKKQLFIIVLNYEPKQWWIFIVTEQIKVALYQYPETYL
jgi:hypothetical protein